MRFPSMTRTLQRRRDLTEENMRITWLGHSAFRLDFGGTAVLIDPFLTGNPSFVGTIEEASRGVGHILLTHGHADHIGDTVAIAKATGAVVVTNFDLCMYLGREGVTKFEPMNTGGTVDLRAFSATLVRADHSTGLVEAGIGFPLGSANGVIVKAPGEKTLYHMGDTDIFSDMGLIAELHNPKIGLVPIGDRFTMGARTAALAVSRYFSFDAVLPCHYASFPLVAGSADAFVDALKDNPVAVMTPRPGESVEV
jgi:L-ascorbate metabolism protein UlaG (beta-lactamase superfamily)